MKKILINLLGFAAGIAAMFVMYLVVYWGITFLAKIPLLGAILYYPSDAMTVRTVSSILTSTFAGGICSAKICGNAKLYAGVVIALNVFTLALDLANSALGWSTLWQAGMYIVVAVICWKLNREAVDEL